MTDNEIIKALECCFDNKEGCDKCPIEDECLLHQPQPILLNHTLDLSTATKLQLKLVEAKAEAIKEFAERLKQRTRPTLEYCEVVLESDIDNLVEEMVGDTE